MNVSSSVHSVLQELGTEQIGPVMRAPLVSHLYTKDGRIAEFSLTLSRKNSNLITNVNEERFLQLVLENHGHGTETPFKAMSTPTFFEIIIVLHSLFMFHDALKEKKFKGSQSYKNGISSGDV